MDLYFLKIVSPYNFTFSIKQNIVQAPRAKNLHILVRGEFMAVWGKKKRIKKSWRVVLVLVLFVFCLILIDLKLAPLIEKIALQQANLAIVKIINQAANEEFAKLNNDAGLITLGKDDLGQINYISPNTLRLNQLSTDIVLKIEEELKILSSQGISIPSGLASGLTLLANLGPNINVMIQPIGSIDVKIEDSLEAAGINQSKYKIALAISVDIQVVVPLHDQVTQVQTKYPLVETVIVGPIPDTYLDFSQ